MKMSQKAISKLKRGYASFIFSPWWYASWILCNKIIISCRFNRWCETGMAQWTASPATRSKPWLCCSWRTGLDYLYPSKDNISVFNISISYPYTLQKSFLFGNVSGKNIPWALKIKPSSDKQSTTIFLDSTFFSNKSRIMLNSDWDFIPQSCC